MAPKNWTPQQLNAINSRGGALLLSAAAGSGKTAVLTERIIKLLTEGDNPIEPSELLVVTFTNAAAKEMKKRINDGIDDLISFDPSNPFLRSVKTKLCDAEITTIDSFCLKLVRENFNDAGVEPDFTILESSDKSILESDAIRETLDDLCKKKPEIYDMLNSVTSYRNDDSELIKKIRRLYDFSRSFPFPDVWLDQVRDMYKTKTGNLGDSVWGRIIFENVLVTIDFCESLINSAANDVVGSEIFEDKYLEPLNSCHSVLKKLKNLINGGEWDELARRPEYFSLGKLPPAPKGHANDPEKLLSEGKFKKAKTLLLSCSEKFCADMDEHLKDCSLLLPVIDALIDAVKNFSLNFERLQKEAGGYTFSDIMHSALKLLVKNENGKIIRTPLAENLEKRYAEILIDEYQDTNEAQDMLFNMISRSGQNIFAVGDVKQSIYRFRLASPDIFIKKSREYAPYDGKTYPAEIILGKNFRSRKGILDNINFLFKHILSDYVGEMEYTDKESLYYGADFNEISEPETELRFYETDYQSNEPAYVASVIEKLLKDRFKISDKNGEREILPGDICVLLRSTAEKAQKYIDALIERGIDATTENKLSLFDSPDFNVFLSLLKVINNPTDDVSLLAVLFSPMFAFTADEVAKIRLSCKDERLITALKKYSETDRKSRVFLEKIDYYRSMSAITPFDIFVRNLLDDTGYMSIVGAFGGGAYRKRDLLILSELAEKYRSSGGSGIGGFIRYIEKAAESKAVVPAFSLSSENENAVKILSIHKSKGLEFPVVILADCSKKFNLADVNDDMIISPKTGVGMVIINDDKLQKYSTVGHIAAKTAVKRSLISEELRVLYVAMTRAKEKLIMVSSLKDVKKTVYDMSLNATDEEKISPAAIFNATSYAQWLIMGYLTHPSFKEKFPDIKIKSRADVPFSPIKITIDSFKGFTPEIHEVEKPSPDIKIINEVKKRAEYKYPYVLPPDQRPKRTASDFEKRAFNPDYFASSKPSFLNEFKLTPAKVGVLNHLFMENVDFNARNAKDELSRMVKEGIFDETSAAVIKIKNMDIFLKSPLVKRIRNADLVLREKEFNVNIPLCEIENDVADNVKNENILVLGKADLVFIENDEAVVVDYKTDRNKTGNELIELYKGQLRIYKNAVEQILLKPVKEAYIYSINNNKEYSVDFK